MDNIASIRVDTKILRLYSFLKLLTVLKSQHYTDYNLNYTTRQAYIDRHTPPN